MLDAGSSRKALGTWGDGLDDWVGASALYGALLVTLTSARFLATGPITQP